MFQRKSPAKRSAKSYQEEATEKKPRAVKRTVIKENKNFATVISPEEINQKIQERAYEIYERRGGSHGDDLSDWLQAEEQIISELNSNKSHLN